MRLERRKISPKEARRINYNTFILYGLSVQKKLPPLEMAGRKELSQGTIWF
jgi:hypothetical protein